jgi:hypothetical protein
MHKDMNDDGFEVLVRRNIVGMAPICDDIIDVWRKDGDRTPVPVSGAPRPVALSATDDAEIVSTICRAPCKAVPYTARAVRSVYTKVAPGRADVGSSCSVIHASLTL